MDYEKEYKEALERAKFYYGNCPSESEKNKLEKMFPVLKESEDELIRKRLINLIKELAANKEAIHTGGYFVDGQDKKYISYLEKQKEQKPEQFKGENLVKIIKGEFEGFRSLLKKKGIDYEPQSNYWESLARLFDSSAREYLKEQEPEVKDPFDDEQFRRGYEAGKHDAMREQKPVEWSEEDSRILYNVIAYIGYAAGQRGVRDDLFKEANDWLKSLRPQPRSKDTYYDIIHNILDTLKDMDFMRITPEHRVSLLNDIRVKCKNADECAAILDEPHWKPSEEQMEALMLAIEGKCAPTSYLSRRLEDLYEALANEFHVECKLDK